MIKFLSALFFAGTLVAIAFLGVWWVAMTAAEKTLLANVSKLMHGGVTAKEIQWNIDPLQVDLQLNDVIATTTTPEGWKVTMNFPALRYKSDLMATVKQEIFFPTDFTLTLTHPTAEAQTYKATAGSAKLQVHAATGVEQAAFTFRTLTLQATAHGLSDTLAFKAQHGAITHIADGTLKISGKNITLGPWLAGTAEQTLDDIYGNILFTNVPQKSISLLTSFFGADSNGFHQALKGILTHISEQKGEVNIRDLRFGWAEKTPQEMVLNMSGKLTADRRLRPEGDLIIATNKPNFVFDTLSQVGLTQTPLTDPDRPFAKILRATVSDDMRLDINIYQGSLTLNGMDAGQVAPLPTMLGM
jgi:hypothetical protein